MHGTPGLSRSALVNAFCKCKYRNIGGNVSCVEKNADYYFSQKVELLSNGNSEFEEIEITRELAAKLTGAPDGSVIKIEKIEEKENIVLIFTVTHDLLFEGEAERLIWRDRNSKKLFMKNEKLRLKNQGTGLGTQMFLCQANTAKSINVKKIVLDAGSGIDANQHPMNGYYFYAQCGFDAQLTKTYEQAQEYISNFSLTDFGTPAKKERAERRLAWYKSWPLECINANSVQDLMSSTQGRVFWQNNPYTTPMEFDLSDSSLSWTVFNKYLESKQA